MPRKAVHCWEGSKLTAVLRFRTFPKCILNFGNYIRDSKMVPKIFFIRKFLVTFCSGPTTLKARAHFQVTVYRYAVNNRTWKCFGLYHHYLIIFSDSDVRDTCRTAVIGHARALVNWQNLYEIKLLVECLDFCTPEWCTSCILPAS